MTQDTFVIKYEIVLLNESPIKNKEMKVKNCFNSIEAQCKLEKFLKKKHNDFKQLIVHSCEKDVMSMFDDMFGANNPFSGSGSAGGAKWPF